MKPFEVWVRPLGESCRVRVRGIGNAEWLLRQLGESHSINNAEPCPETPEADICSFEVPCSEPKSRNRLEKVLASIPEVKLMMRPE